MSEFYDRKGNPIDMIEWAKSIEGKVDRKVAADTVGDVLVSTVWLGMNHRWGEGPPLIFETMVFGGALDGDMDRYSTEAEALAGHAEILTRVKAAISGLDPETGAESETQTLAGGETK